MPMSRKPVNAKTPTRRPRSSAYGGATTIDEYLARVEPEQRAALEAVRQVIRKAAPNAEEVITYGIPAFRQNGFLIGFAASAKHCSLHPMNNHTVADFATDLAGYSTSTGTIRFTPDTPLPAALVRRIVRARVAGLGTGCRLDEIRGIDPERDIDWTRGMVHVIGKFRKERDVPMQPDARAALEEQLEEDGKLWKQNPQRLREVLAEGTARAKVAPLTPHALRHTFGTRWCFDCLLLS